MKCDCYLCAFNCGKKCFFATVPLGKDGTCQNRVFLDLKEEAKEKRKELFQEAEVITEKFEAILKEKFKNKNKTNL